MRLISCAATIAQVKDRSKTVTRRTGWKFVKPGDLLQVVEKAMGRKPGEPLVHLAVVRVVRVNRQMLDALTDDDVAREGFPGRDRDWFFEHVWRPMHPKADWSDWVTRIEWEYVE